MEEVSEGIHVPKVYSSPECDGRLFQAVKAKPLRFRRGTLMDKGQVSLLQGTGATRQQVGLTSSE